MKYSSPPFKVTPVMPVMETKSQQVPDPVLVDRLHRALATSDPGAPPTSVQIETEKESGEST